MLKMIACINSNGGIGRNNKLIIQMAEDVERFKSKTMGNIVVMGRKTWESLSRKPLANRENIVLTRKNILLEGAKIVNNPRDIIHLAEESTEDVYIIGGAEIYRLFIEDADVLELTEVDVDNEADAFFPDFNEDDFNVTYVSDVFSEKYDGVFKTYERKSRIGD